MKEEILVHLQAAGAISSLDAHFAKLMVRLDGGDAGAELALAAALVCSATRRGHVCIDLRGLGGRSLASAPALGPLPEVRAWCETLGKSAVVGRPQGFKPLILDDAGRLYIYRYWEYQQKLAEALRSRIAAPAALTETVALKEWLDRLFPPAPGELDWQKIAALAGALRPFCVVSGGPGTGKTTTVAKILALLLGQAETLRIALAAPTGKAAARLQEAIKQARRRLDCPEAIRERIPEAACTIHRLLGTVPGSHYFRHSAENPLPVDVLVVDEASMVDLALMSKLLQALPRQARLILLGDKDQLSSVEAGAVLGDICSTGGAIRFSKDFAGRCESLCGCRLEAGCIQDDAASGSGDCIVELQKSYRFTGESGIALLGRAVRERDPDGSFRALKSGAYPDLGWSELPAGRLLGKAIRAEVVEGFRAYLSEAYGLTPGAGEEPNERLAKVFSLFEQFRILCALREGPFGVVALNALVEAILDEAHLLSRSRRWYVGRPVMVMRNDYSLRLFNGDIGIFLPDILNGSDHRVFFPGVEGQFRSFHPLRLPEHETVFAMTVHKSQGSEFDRVLLLLPDRDTPLLTRELLYTGITRARQHVSLWGREPVVRTAISRSTERLSGLAEALWESAGRQ